MTVQDAVYEAIGTIEDAVGSLPCVNASNIGLDTRAGFVYVDVESRCLITPTIDSSRLLEYYGGFEYVDVRNIIRIGPYTIYLEENFDGETDSRITEALDHFNNRGVIIDFNG